MRNLTLVFLRDELSHCKEQRANKLPSKIHAKSNRATSSRHKFR